MTRRRATFFGFTAILMWALLALFTVGSAPVPPFLLSALCFGTGRRGGFDHRRCGAGDARQQPLILL
jgi:hypothetical protein